MVQCKDVLLSILLNSVGAAVKSRGYTLEYRGGFDNTKNCTLRISCFFIPASILGALSYPLIRRCMSRIRNGCAQRLIHGNRAQLKYQCMHRGEVHFCKDGFHRSSMKLAIDNPSRAALRSFLDSPMLSSMSTVAAKVRCIYIPTSLTYFYHYR